MLLTGRKRFSPLFFFSLPVQSRCCSLCVLSQPVVSDSLRPHGLYPTMLLCPWNPCPGKNAGVGSHSLRQGIFPTQGLNPGPATLQADSPKAAPTLLHGTGSARSASRGRSVGRCLLPGCPRGVAHGAARVSNGPEGSRTGPEGSRTGPEGSRTGSEGSRTGPNRGAAPKPGPHAAPRAVWRQLTRTHSLPSGVGDCASRKCHHSH